MVFMTELYNTNQITFNFKWYILHGIFKLIIALYDSQLSGLVLDSKTLKRFYIIDGLSPREYSTVFKLRTTKWFQVTCPEAACVTNFLIVGERH